MPRKLFIAVVGASLCLVMGCLPEGFKDGHFEGTLQLRPELRSTLFHAEINEKGRRSEGLSSFAAPALIDSTLVSIDLKFDKEIRGEVEIKDMQGKLLYLIAIEKLSQKKFYLSISSISPEPVEMSLEPKSQGCFSSSGDPVIQICAKENRLAIQVSHKKAFPFFALTGDRFAKEVPFPLETPVEMTLSDAIAQALKGNFNSRIEFEHTLQARLTAKAAFLNLLPHLNLANLLTNFPLSVYSVLAVVGDLCPFLLPNRWFMAKEAGQLFQAEKYAEILMQADLATQVEGLGYIFQRDLELFDFTRIMAGRVREVRDKVLALEDLEQFPLGSSDHLNAYANVLDLDAYSLGEVVKVDKRALSQALGYHNPDAVEGILFNPEVLSLDQAIRLDDRQLGQIALERSFELQQVDALIVYSEYKKEEFYFSWLDPTTDPTIELGLALGDVVAVGQSRIEELKIKREQLQSILLQKMSGAVYQYNNAIEIYPQVTQGLEIQDRRIRRVLEQVVPHSNLNTLDIQQIYQDYVVNWMRQQQAVVDFRIARSNIDRMLLQGYYSTIFSKYFDVLKLKFSQRWN